MDFTYNLPQNQYRNEFYQKLIDTPHLIIGGTTGSGKSVLIDNILYYLLYNFSENTRLILIDPKKVSLAKYKDLPFIERYADNNQNIIQALQNVVSVMDSIYSEMQTKNIYMYDGITRYVIIDELADLLTYNETKRIVLPLLQRIAQLGRASKIHLICATQSPSRAVLSAQLTLNFTGRLALRCATTIESKQVLNGFSGAECLPQYGKCLYVENGNLYTANIEMLPDQKINDLINFYMIQWNAVKPSEIPVSNNVKQGLTDRQKTLIRDTIIFTVCALLVACLKLWFIPVLLWLFN